MAIEDAFLNPYLAGSAADGFAGAMLAMFAGMIVFIIVLGLAFYVYMSFALMTTAKRLKIEPAWLAWIPIGNFYLMAKMAKMPVWPVWVAFGFLIPFLNFAVGLFFLVMATIWTWKICEARKRPGWWAVIPLGSVIPIIGILAGVWSLIMWGILAWAKK